MDRRREDLRVADGDRASVAEILRRAVDEGRLTLGEYDERLQSAYLARTYGDLDKLIVDLPVSLGTWEGQVNPGGATVLPDAPEPIGSATAGGGYDIARKDRAVIGDGPEVPRLITMWSTWAGVAVMTTAIWGMTAIGSGGSSYFWPMWALAPWGAVLVAKTLAWKTCRVRDISGMRAGMRAQRDATWAGRRAQREALRLERRQWRYGARAARRSWRRGR